MIKALKSNNGIENIDNQITSNIVASCLFDCFCFVFVCLFFVSGGFFFRFLYNITMSSVENGSFNGLTSLETL